MLLEVPRLTSKGTITRILTCLVDVTHEHVLAPYDSKGANGVGIHDVGEWYLLCGVTLLPRIAIRENKSLSAIQPPRAREKLDTMEPTLLLSSLVYLVLFPCSLQTCSVFPFYEVQR
jgi:hypothetical protein